MPDRPNASSPHPYSPAGVRVAPEHIVTADSAGATRRMIALGRRRASINLEDAFWNGLRDIASDRGLTVATLVAAVDAGRRGTPLPSALRLFVLGHFRARALALLIGQRVTPQPPRPLPPPPGTRLNVTA